MMGVPHSTTRAHAGHWLATTRSGAQRESGGTTPTRMDPVGWWETDRFLSLQQRGSRGSGLWLAERHLDTLSSSWTPRSHLPPHVEAGCNVGRGVQGWARRPSPEPPTLNACPQCFLEGLTRPNAFRPAGA